MGNKIKDDWVKSEIIKRCDYNPETGSLTWAKRDSKYFNDRYFGKEVGYSHKGKDGYITITVRFEIKGYKISTTKARVCWLVHTGDWPKETVDHIDRNPFNNRWDNLRDVSQAENNRNKGPYRPKIKA